MSANSEDRSIAYDHFVYLLDTAEFETPPPWLSDNFHIIEGGTHAGGSSRNKLIIFKDGTYLELFNWIQEPKEFLNWADKKPGLIDFALTNLPPITALQNYVTLSQALQDGGDGKLGISYDHPRAGGRKRQDGQDVKWETTRPLFVQADDNTPNDSFFPTKRLDVPFFCHDITDRSVRVPFADDKITEHPCGAVGVSAVDVLVPGEHFESYVTAYRSVLGRDQTASSTKNQDQHSSVRIHAPNSQTYHPTVGIQAVKPQGKDEEHDINRNWLRERGIGIRRLVLTTKKTSNGQSTTVRPLDAASLDAATIAIEIDRAEAN